MDVPTLTNTKANIQMMDENSHISYRSTIEECMQEAKSNNLIWKISWVDSQTNETVRLVKMQIDGHNIWVYSPLKFI